MYVNITGVPRIFPFILALMPSRALTSLLLLFEMYINNGKYSVNALTGFNLIATKTQITHLDLPLRSINALAGFNLIATELDATEFPKRNAYQCPRGLQPHCYIEFAAAVLQDTQVSMPSRASTSLLQYGEPAPEYWRHDRINALAGFNLIATYRHFRSVLEKRKDCINALAGFNLIATHNANYSRFDKT